MRLLFALLCAWICPALLTGCSTPRPDPKWISGDVQVGSEPRLWVATRMALEKNNFPVGAGIDAAHMSAVSGWMHSLAPFRGKGFRERCHVQWTRVAEGRWHLELRVERDRNDDISHPLDMSYAQWEPDPDDEDRARLVAQYIRSLLGTH
jgi:hypothetical protein